MAYITDLAGLQAALATPVLAEVDGVTIATTTTLTLTQSTGCGIVGRCNSEAGGWFGSPTKIVWNGAAGGTVLNIDRSSVGLLKNFTIVAGSGRPGIGIKFTSDSGWGTGRFRLQNVTVRDAVVGVQMANADGDINNADCVFDQCGFELCDTAFKSVATQVVNIKFRDCIAGYCGTLIDFVKGGNFQWDGGHIGTFDWLLKAGYGGPNASKFKFTNLRIELGGHTKRNANLVDADAGSDMVDVVFQDCQETQFTPNGALPDNPNDYKFLVGAKTTLLTERHVHYNRRVVTVTGGGTYRDHHSRWPYHAPETSTNWSMSAGAGRIFVLDPLDINGNLLTSLIMR